MVLLFGRDKSVINRHINNIFKENELSKETTIAKNATMLHGREYVNYLSGKKKYWKFDQTFRFKLNKEEWEKILRSKKTTANSHSENDLRSQNVTANLDMRRYLPYAFTEQGIYMLMTVLKGELATKQSILLIKTFKEMKDYELIKFKNDQLELDVKVSPEEDTVWLALDEMALLFGRDKSVINRHINNIFKENELSKETTIAKNATMLHWKLY